MGDTRELSHAPAAGTPAPPHPGLRARVKGLVERSFGVTISRTPPPPVNQHADAALRQLRRWSSDDVVFDVGANDGRTILRLQHQLSSPRFYAFEPVSSTYRTLVERTAHLPNVRAFHLALGAAPGTGTIYLSDIHAMDSFSPAWTAAPTGTETVAVATIDEVLDTERIDFVDFLKIDTEGYELEVLTGAERALRDSRIGIVQVEVGVDQMDRSFLPLEAARAHMAARGYFLYGIYNQCRTPAVTPAGWPEDAARGYRPEVLAYCDALFIRTELACERDSSRG